MQKTFDLEVDGIKFQCIPLPLTTRLKLDKHLLALLSPIASKMASDDSGISAAVQALPEMLQNLPDENFLKLVSMTLSHTTAITDKGALSLADEMSRDAVFENLLTLYKLLMELWRYNKLTVFALAASHNTGG